MWGPRSLSSVLRSHPVPCGGVGSSGPQAGCAGPRLHRRNRQPKPAQRHPVPQEHDGDSRWEAPFLETGSCASESPLSSSPRKAIVTGVGSTQPRGGSPERKLRSDTEGRKEVHSACLPLPQICRDHACACALCARVCPDGPEALVSVSQLLPAETTPHFYGVPCSQPWCRLHPHMQQRGTGRGCTQLGAPQPGKCAWGPFSGRSLDRRVRGAPHTQQKVAGCSAAVQKMNPIFHSVIINISLQMVLIFLKLWLSKGPLCEYLRKKGRKSAAEEGSGR